MGSTPPVRRHHFTTRDYFRMAELGILAEDRRFELIEAEIIEVSPPGNRHSAVVSRINAMLAPVATGRAIVRVQDPVILSDFSVVDLVRDRNSRHASDRLLLTNRRVT